MPISKKTRFEVFKRDEFICQYCGRKPPEIILEIDHILPKSKKGSDDIINLITSCRDCNRGKAYNEIKNKICRDDINALNEEVIEKEEQLKEYYRLLANKERRTQRILKHINEYWIESTNGEYELNNQSLKSIRYFLKHFTKYDIMEAIDTAFSKTYIESSSRFKYMCGILHSKIRARAEDFDE